MSTPHKIIWFIQSNQTTQVIADYLKILQTRVEKFIDLEFWIPDSSAEDAERLSPLNPRVIKTDFKSAPTSYGAYQAKRDALGKSAFNQGLSISDTLLLDDLGGGVARMVTIMASPTPETCGLILQTPSPLGSSEIEEANFHAAILWCRHHKIPVLGYELLPLSTRWTLAPALTDGIITREEESYHYLRDELAHKNIWLLPAYEAAIFTSISTNFHLNGVKASYHYRNHHKIPANRTVLYIPHNVAMVHEYQTLLKTILPLGQNLHLMFSVGKDQIRGAYTHEQMIEIVYQHELEKYASYSFHDANNLWEMMMADAVLAASTGLNTMVAEKDIPCIVFDPQKPDHDGKSKRHVNSKKDVLRAVQALTEIHPKKMELADILMLLTTSRKTNG